MTHFVKLQDGSAVIGVIIEDNLRQIVPELASVRLFTPDLVEPHGYGIFDFSQPPELGRHEKAIEIAPVRDERGIWMQAWTVGPMNEDEAREADERQTGLAREQRRFRLFTSDWTQMPDSPLTADQKAAWAVYRQQLRDVPTQVGFPWDIVWPEAPKNL